MRNLENANAEELAEIRLWMFQENVRLESGKQELREQMRKLETEKRSLEQEKHLFERKWTLLENGFKNLEEDRKKVEEERRRLHDSQNAARYSDSGKRLFFRGIDNQSALKKRYKELVKIFHPDNPAGDRETILTINQEYDSLRMYLN